ncbi:GNAT family N-acetyltransferase [Isoptericola sp. NEAU-Y5]|uniref:GNAT family N-acetyltransferase n=1 Tax=Isoptericola luteus TaxID=2879484 RepID=A0ABS7ZIB2_9MICO|nr:GNAT family N-acetyltransferase [Isoptericola sp. NEAU-Y5]MCA5894760.1 GNAT family N-acetyltransferase [Isoptericola sp. NEAU-Y5]
MIRTYRPSDRAAVAEVCVRTAAGGTDARGVYSDDRLMPEVFALPYVEYAPDLAFVVVHPLDETETARRDPADEVLHVEDGVLVGYVLGVADTRAFVDWWQESWGPGFDARHPAPGISPTGAEPGFTEESLLRCGSDATRMVTGISAAELDAYPAHLHIDLLPQAQGQGLGRTLMDTLRAALADQGVPGVHLGMDPTNTGARAFYDRYGFVELPSHTATAPLLGITTA